MTECPRKVVELAMRKLGVEEWLVRAVMAMYKHARTRIKIIWWVSK